MYKCQMKNCAFKSEEGVLYILDMETPFLHKTEQDAKRDSTVYRFRKEDKKVKLIAYERELLVTDTDKEGRKIARSVPVGDPVSRYTYKQFKELGGRIRRQVDTSDMVNGFSHSELFEQSYETFDELFPELGLGKEIYVAPGTEKRVYKSEK